MWAGQVWLASIDVKLAQQQMTTVDICRRALPRGNFAFQIFGAVSANSATAEAALALLKFLRSEDAIKVIRSQGMLPAG